MFHPALPNGIRAVFVILTSITVAAKLAAVLRLESFTLKNRSSFSHSSWTSSVEAESHEYQPLSPRLSNIQPYASKHPCARLILSLLLGMISLGLTSCSQNLYKFPQYTFANRPIPPSLLANRVMVSVSFNGTQGGLTILDGNRDIRSNVQNTVKAFAISGYSSGYPNRIFNFPEQTRGYVYSDSDATLSIIDYGKEATGGSAGSFVAHSTMLDVPSTSARIIASLENLGEIVVIDNSTGRTFYLNLPNVYQVAMNQSGNIGLAMVRNSNTLYRILKLNPNQANPPGAVDCQPYNLPVYCVVPVPGTYDRPLGAYFSLCNKECENVWSFPPHAPIPGTEVQGECLKPPIP